MPTFSSALVTDLYIFLFTLAKISPLPQIMFHQNYLTLFSAIQNSNSGLLGIRRKAFKLNQITQVHEGFDCL